LEPVRPSDAELPSGSLPRYGSSAAKKLMGFP
jgi:hypothetical protein